MMIIMTIKMMVILIIFMIIRIIAIIIIIIFSIVIIINPISYTVNATNVISAVVPVELISMFTEKELEGIFCGEAEVDLIILRKATIYESVSIHDR